MLDAIKYILFSDDPKISKGNSLTSFKVPSQNCLKFKFIYRKKTHSLTF